MLSLFTALTLAISAPALDATDEVLELNTSSASAIDVQVSFADFVTATGAPAGSGSQRTAVSSATTTTILSAPGSSNTRGASFIAACNTGAASNTIILRHDKAGTESVIGRASLGPSECAKWDGQGVLTVYAAGGLIKGTAGLVGGRSYQWSKTATATDAAAYGYASWKDAGRPGAYSLGTPGLNGVVTDCSVVGTAGSGGALSLGAPLFANAGSGSLYISSVTLTAQAVGLYALVDVLWYNTGLAVTTTTAQAITTPTLPARDVNASTNGEGVELALLTTTANTNAAVISNTTASYTDSDGNAGNSATFSALVGFQAPATPVIGTWMPFSFATSDRGIRALASVTLGTSYGAGALSAVLYRPLVSVGIGVANTPTVVTPAIQTPIYNGSCLAWVFVGGTGTTAPVIGQAEVQVVER